MKITPLSGPLGVEVTDIDLTAPVSDSDFALIRQAWLDGLVLIVRDQQLSKEAQLKFARRFGELEEVRTKKDDDSKTQYVLYVSNREVEGSKGALPDGEMYFHSDQCYYERPCKATILNAIEIPSKGGETLFSNMQLAYRELPDDLKNAIQGREIVNLYDYERDPTTRNLEFNSSAPHFQHPIVVEHPETGVEGLFVNRQMTHHIVGMPIEESEAILSRIFDHIEQPRYVYEHVWQPFDLVMWDNRAVLHARRDFDPAEARVLRRITVKGTRPVAPGKVAA